MQKICQKVVKFVKQGWLTVCKKRDTLTLMYFKWKGEMNMAVKKAALACSVCGSRNYSKAVSTSRNANKRLEINKFCKYCNQYTLHRETKQEEVSGMKFIKSVIDEMKRVTWPTKQQLRKDTIVVIETSIIFAVMFFVMDTVIQKLLALVLK